MKNTDLIGNFHKAQNGDKNALKEILNTFEPLIYKNSFIKGKFDQDCFQELNIKLIGCIKRFDFSPDANIYESFNIFIKNHNNYNFKKIQENKTR